MPMLGHAPEDARGGGRSVPIDPKWFRQVLGHYPTGVCVVTAQDPDGGDAGMAVGSFTSVSLDPPLIAFLVDKTSTTWPRIQRAHCFCVNVLAADQEHVCRAFAAKGGAKFHRLHSVAAATGSPILDGVIAWIDCDIHDVHEAGDHYIVVGRVRELDIANPGLPLLFFQGGYGRFIPQSLASADLDVIKHFRQVDIVRPELEALAEEIGIEANASVRIGDAVVAVATAGQPRGRHIGTRVGHRYALVPPVGAVLVAWAPDSAIDAWLRLADGVSSADALGRERAALAWVRENGYSLIVGSIAPDTDGAAPTPDSPRDLRRVVRDVRLACGAADAARGADEDFWATISAPVFDPAGDVSLLVNLNGFDAPLDKDELSAHVERLTAATARITAGIRGRLPDQSATPR